MTTVFVNGTFDILHQGHLKMLEYAASLGDYLLVAIDVDHRVRELKGSGRPINNQEDRRFMLSRLKGVDEVVLFDNDDALEHIIQVYQPDIMVKGSDYRNKPIIGEEHCGQIIFYEHTNHSTTKIIQRITNR
jgi:D-beta-D-heptose 7-phosphate kinase/D-beta-D-heptose 1-phosphate adenosyltransferase